MKSSSSRRLEWSLAGLVCACGPAPGSTDGASAGGSTSAPGGSTSAPGESTSGTATSDGSGSSATPTTGEPAPFCADPQPIFMRGGEVPSGFIRCANGVVHRAQVVECAVEGVGDCMSGNDECDSDIDCVDAPHGTCHQLSFVGCFCDYGCGSDADCAEGEICACAGVLGRNHSQCIPAGCVDSGGCGAGLCALVIRGSTQCGALAVAEAACIDEGSACLVHDDCRELPETEQCGACLPADGAWSCGEIEGCGIVC